MTPSPKDINEESGLEVDPVEGVIEGVRSMGVIFFSDHSGDEH